MGRRGRKTGRAARSRVGGGVVVSRLSEARVQ